MTRNLSELLYDSLLGREGADNLSINGYNVFTSNSNQRKLVIPASRIVSVSLLAYPRRMAEVWSCGLQLFTRATDSNISWGPAHTNLMELLEFLYSKPSLDDHVIDFMPVGAGEPTLVQSSAGRWIMQTIDCRASIHHNVEIT